jgi:hypothetical protein
VIPEQFLSGFRVIFMRFSRDFQASAIFLKMWSNLRAIGDRE